LVSQKFFYKHPEKDKEVDEVGAACSEIRPERHSDRREFGGVRQFEIGGIWADMSSLCLTDRSAENMTVINNWKKAEPGKGSLTPPFPRFTHRKDKTISNL